MSYLPHIENLYKNQQILMFKHCFALEKIHGTATKLNWDSDQLTYSSGGESHERFVNLFDNFHLKAVFLERGYANRKVTVYGEAYGGKQQGMSHTYGPNLKFIAFDVCLDEGNWLNVPDADAFCKSLGIEFVHYVKISTDLKEIDAQRDAPSIQAIRNGISMVIPEGADFCRPSGTVVEPYGKFEDRIANPKKREGVVLRPLIELTNSLGSRIICKHKGDEFRETTSPRVVDDPAKLQVLADADKIATEWITISRLQHVLDKIPDYVMEKMPIILKAMVEDITREASGEIIDSDAVRKAITKKTATMFKDYLKANLNGK